MPIPWGSLAGLAGDTDGTLYAIESERFAQPRILVIDSHAHPALITDDIQVTYQNGSFWVELWDTFRFPPTYWKKDLLVKKFQRVQRQPQPGSPEDFDPEAIELIPGGFAVLSLEPQGYVLHLLDEDGVIQSTLVDF